MDCALATCSVSVGSAGRAPTSCGEPASVVVQALLAPPLAQFLLACALVNQACCVHFHSRNSLRTLASGLPSNNLDDPLRCRMWRRLCLGSMVFGDGMGTHTYTMLTEREAAADAEIRRDIGRTFPECLGEESTEALFRVLRAISHRLEDIGYCQGMNFIAGVLLQVFQAQQGAESRTSSTPIENAAGHQPAASEGPVKAQTAAKSEALVYQCVVSILSRHGMNQYFGHRFPKLRLTALQFDCLVEAFLPDLGQAFDVFNISADFYATQWFLTLFSCSLPIAHVVRVWDHFLCRGMKFVHRVGLALLNEARPILLSLGFDDLAMRLRDLGQHTALSPDELICAALEFKVTNRLLSELEHAMAIGTSPSEGARTLPLCFPERDLDSGRTRWRLHMAMAAESCGTPLAGSIAAGMTLHPDDTEFLEDALPAPRIPGDPRSPFTPMGNFLEAAEELPLPSSKGGRRRRPKLRRLPKTVLEKLRHSSSTAKTGSSSSSSSSSSIAQVGAVAVKETSETTVAALEQIQEQPQEGDPLPTELPVAKTAVPFDGESRRRSGVAVVRSSSMPSMKFRKSLRKPPPLVENIELAAAARIFATIQDVTPDLSESEQPKMHEQSIPIDLLPFAVKNLDTGKYSLLGDGSNDCGGQAAAPQRHSSPPHRSNHRSWASKQVSKLRHGRSKRDRCNDGGSEGSGGYARSRESVEV